MSQVQRQALGRGLAALFESTAQEPSCDEKIFLIPVKLIDPNPFQPRHSFDEVGLQELAASIRENGVLQPLLVVSHTQGRYKLVAGERRLRACQLLEKPEVPCRLLSLDHQQMLEVALLENIQRDDLNALEEAYGYQHLISSFGHTQEALAKKIGKSRSHISNILRILQLPSSVHALIHEQKLSAGHAKALLSASDPQQLSQEIINQNLTVRQSEQRAKESKVMSFKEKASFEDKEEISVKKKASFVKELGEEQILASQLSEITEMSVEIKTKANGSGKILISFDSITALDQFVERIHQAFNQISRDGEE